MSCEFKKDQFSNTEYMDNIFKIHIKANLIETWGKYKYTQECVWIQKHCKFLGENILGKEK